MALFLRNVQETSYPTVKTLVQTLSSGGKFDHCLFLRGLSADDPLSLQAVQFSTGHLHRFYIYMGVILTRVFENCKGFFRIFIPYRPEHAYLSKC